MVLGFSPFQKPRGAVTVNDLSFDVWLSQVREDAERNGFKSGFNNIPVRALELFWSDGVEASMAGIIEGKKPSQSSDPLCSIQRFA